MNLDRTTADINRYLAELEAAVPDACPHGYGPVIVNRVDIGLLHLEVLAPMSYRCPDHCPHRAEGSA